MDVGGMGRAGERLPRLLALQLLLMGCGAVVLYSNSSISMLLRHSVWLLLGVALALALAVVPLEKVWHFTPLLLVLALLINLAPHIPGLQLSNAGSARWIQVGGVSLQASEVLKFAMVLYLSRVCAELQDLPLRFSKLWLPAGMVALAMVLVILQKDYSTTLLLLAVLTVLLLFFSPLLSLYMVLLAGVATLLAFFVLNQSFRVQRVHDWLGEGSAQINWVHRAVERGGWWGVGMGRGEKKLIIPAEMTDFPLSSLGEEAGLIGIAVVVLLFFLYSMQGLRLARCCQNYYMRYLCIGLVTLFTLQALTNLLVTVGMVPVTGQPLPFFSVGGSSVVVNLAGFGLLNSVRRHLQLGGRRA